MTKPAQAADGIWWMRTLMANVAFLGSADRWILVDAGLRGYAGAIERAAAELFGSSRAPEAIVLTHGHFDHVGSIQPLVRRWRVPVYAHTLELPYITGLASYPPPDPLVGGGGMSWSSPLLPRGPIDLGHMARQLPADGSVPGVDGWRWVHTPGHTPGHVSLVRDADRAVIAGDAVVTTRQESLLAVATQREELHGPPAYFTSDWISSADSVRALAALQPSVLVTGHGYPMAGQGMREALADLARRFEDVEVPSWGRYVRRPARADERGPVWVPDDLLAGVIAKAAVPVAAGLLIARAAARRGSRRAAVARRRPAW